VTRGKTRRPGEFSIQPASGIDKGHKCSCWPRPDDARPCTPQTCDPRCRACRTHGRPFYSHGDLLYLEHGTGPLAAELRRLWRGKGTMKGGTAHQGAGHDGDGWQALPRGAAGLAPRRPHALPVTELYYPGLQDPHQAMTAATPAAGSSWTSTSDGGDDCFACLGSWGMRLVCC
jgi:hypothetical protein